MLSVTLCLFVLGATSAVAETVAGLPVHIDKINEKAIRVWIGDTISSTNTVAIATEEGLIIIDTLGLPEVDRELRAIIARELGRDDFKYLINTHEHGDHVGGNGIYADCTIVGHELVAASMTGRDEHRQGVVDWLTRRIAEQETELTQLESGSPEATRMQEDLAHNRLELTAAEANAKPFPPTKTFTDRMTLDCGDTTFELYYIGGMHSASDIAVWVPEHGLLMTGDTMADTWLTDTPGCLASFMARSGIPHDFPLWLENWNHLLAKKNEIELILPGHWNGELSYAGAEARVKYVETLWTATNKAYKSGEDMDYMLAEYQLASHFPELVDSPGFSARNNYSTVVEMWVECSGQESAARAIYALVDEGGEKSAVQNLVATHGTPSSPYYFSEGEFNALGYQFLQTDRADQAVVLFRINAKLYPESWNVYDSLGEGLLATGARDEAIAMYERSLELNPESPSGLDALERIRHEDSVN